MEARIQLLAIVASGILLLMVLELVRRRRLMERYALLWLLSGIVLLVLSTFRGLLEDAAQLIGVEYPPSALFFIAFAFVLLLLLHFSVAVSRLADQSKVLAQRLAILEKRVRDVEAVEGPGAEAAEEAERPRAAAAR
jgi:hypothetical protein